MSNDPAKYYKYRPLYRIGKKGREVDPSTEMIFNNASLWYSLPSKFNDPYDCNLRLHANDSTDKEWMQYIDGQLREKPASHFPHDHKVLKKTKKEKLWKTNPSISKNIGHGTLEMNRERSSVLCLSRRGNSIPMFSYYANSHSGIAIEFTFSDKNVPCDIEYILNPHSGIIFGDVEYHKVFPELNYHRLYGSDRLVKHIIFSKHHEWEHEDEYRIFRRGTMPSAVPFDSGILTRVVFGCKTEADDILLVKEWLKRWPTDVVLSRATEVSNKFELDIIDFDYAKGVGIS